MHGECQTLSYRWTGRVWGQTGWSSRLEENHRSFQRNFEEYFRVREYASKSTKKNRKMSTCNRLKNTRISTDNAQHWHWNKSQKIQTTRSHASCRHCYIYFIIAMLILCYSIMPHATLVLFYHAFMLPLHKSLISHALWLPHKCDIMEFRVYYYVLEFPTTKKMSKSKARRNLISLMLVHYHLFEKDANNLICLLVVQHISNEEMLLEFGWMICNNVHWIFSKLCNPMDANFR